MRDINQIYTLQNRNESYLFYAYLHFTYLYLFKNEQLEMWNLNKNEFLLVDITRNDSLEYFLKIMMAENTSPYSHKWTTKQNQKRKLQTDNCNLLQGGWMIALNLFSVYYFKRALHKVDFSVRLLLLMISHHVQNRTLRLATFTKQPQMKRDLCNFCDDIL